MATLEWFGCATFRLEMSGRSILLDAYLDRATGAATSGVGADDIDACDWILIGHSHFDHLYGAARIMQRTDATLVGSYETVRVMEEAGVPADRMLPVGGGETVDLGDDLRAHVYPSQHSCVWSHGQMAQPHEVCLGDLGVTWQEQQQKFAELTEYLSTSLEPTAVEHLLASMGSHSPRGDGGALVYVLENAEGSVLFQDTSGHWSGVLRTLRPSFAILAAAGRANVDGEPIQGSLLDFLRAQVEALVPTHVALCHHDDWLPGFSVPTEMGPIRELFRQLPTELVELDYASPYEIPFPRG